MLPLLQFYAGGGEVSRTDVLEAMAREFDVSAAELAIRLPKGQLKFANCVDFAQKDLRVARLIERIKHGYNRITARGQELLRENIAAIDEAILNRYPEYREHRQRKEEKNRERSGDAAIEEPQFQWTRFYEAVADKMLNYQSDRSSLVRAIHDIAGRVGGMSYLQDQFTDGTRGPMRDIGPFTAMSPFNRGTTDENRKIIAGEMARFLGVDVPVPESFEGVPFVNNQISWVMAYEKDRQPDDIDVLWSLFAAAIHFADSSNPESRQKLVNAYDKAFGRYVTKGNLIIGLYWVRPWYFCPLDGNTKKYIAGKLGIKIDKDIKRSGAAYLALLESLNARFQEATCPVHSFPELSLAAGNYGKSGTNTNIEDEEEEIGQDEDDMEPSDGGPIISPYSIDDIIDDGCFLSREELIGLLERLRMKKNVILQGPPGTGKTWLARRLAFALMGRRDEGCVRAVQFHPNLSYEDFVRGWRPADDGKLALIDGPFLQMIHTARQQADATFVLVIEEINRGNPAQIFGEMLTLLEADKRNASEALELCYLRGSSERVFIPDNLYVIGTMNIADRSLALVDFALRRRFAFVDLEPQIGSTWRDWVSTKHGIEADFLDDIKKRMAALNKRITEDTGLGRQFCIGHSYVTPPTGSQISDPQQWFRDVVNTEIGPLLDEYWFDAEHKAKEAQRHLLEGLD